MSGISGKLNNDQCYFDQHNQQSVQAMNYAQFLPFYVSPTSITTLEQCSVYEDGTSGCTACNANTGSTISVAPEGFSKRVDIENCLKNINKPLSACTNNNIMCAGEVAFNPRLCERDITPTNIPKFQ